METVSWKQASNWWGKGHAATVHWTNTRTGREAHMTGGRLGVALMQVLDIMDAKNARDVISNVRITVVTGPNERREVMPPADVWAWFEASAHWSAVAKHRRRKRAL